MTQSPYENLSVENWEAKTREIIAQHPLDINEVYQIVIEVWREIFQSKITSREYQIGINLFPSPQIMGYFLHELIPLELADRYPGIWRREETKLEKDIVYIPDSYYSVEIKTSSSPRNIYGNRSYAQKSSNQSKTRKAKFGYYLVINFEKFTQNRSNPQISMVRFGWLDLDDWIGQKAATGQQARLSPEVERYKLLKLPLEELK